jgi:hypothetical protein
MRVVSLDRKYQSTCYKDHFSFGFKIVLGDRCACCSILA